MIVEIKPRKNKQGLWYIAQSRDSFSWYLYLFNLCGMDEFNGYINYILKNFNGKLDGKIYFNTKEDTEKAIDYIESTFTMLKLTQ